MRIRLATSTFLIATAFLAACGSGAAKEQDSATPRTKNAALVVSCANGGECVVGDIGPGGGTVFYDAGSVQPWGRYLEAAPKDAGANLLWCDVYRDIPGAAGTAIGDGKQNTVDMDAACNGGVGQVAADYANNGRDDWYLPAKDELIAMFKQKKLLGLNGQFLFSSSETGTWNAWDIYMGNGEVYPQGKNNGRIVRPIRAFAATPASTTTAPAVTTTSAATTTVPVTTTAAPVMTTTTTAAPAIATAVSCATGAACKVGDVGPGGGKIFFDSGKDNSWGRYLEVAPQILNEVKVWCNIRPNDTVNGKAIGDGYFNTATRAGQCAQDTGLRYAWDYTTQTRDDWFMPSVEEMKALAQASQNILGTYYWTSTRYDSAAITTVSAAYKTRGSEGMDHITVGGKMTAPIRYVRAGETSAKPATPPTTTTTTIVTTTTLPPVTTTVVPCAKGGACKVGDTTATGGIIFYDAGSKQSWGRYLEAAPRDMNNGTNNVVADLCEKNVPYTIAGATGTAIGDGKANTAAFAKACSKGAPRIADDFVFGGKDDWYLPSKDELDALLKRVDIFGKESNLNPGGFYSIPSACYWSSSQTTPNSQWYGWAQRPNDMSQFSYYKIYSCSARFIRVFG